MDYEVQDFEEDVIETSYRMPVLVDFWAPWCGPCRFLGPVLEKLAGENTGRWRLVKVHTDQHPEVSAAYGIRGIPAVKLFVEGEVVDEFTGALPEQAVRQWLEKALPTEGKRKLERARLELDAGNRTAAERLLMEVVDAEPENAEARVLLARLIVFRHPEQAAALAEGAAFAGPGLVQIEEAVRTVAHLFRVQQHPDVLPEGEGRETYLEAARALTAQQFDDAVTGFLEVLRRNRYYDDDGARKACIAVFNLLGDEHPVTRRHRRLFDMALY